MPLLVAVQRPLDLKEPTAVMKHCWLPLGLYMLIISSEIDVSGLC